MERDNRAKIEYYEGLNGLRVVTAFLIVFGHVIANGYPNVPVWFDLIFHGTKYVRIFFMLSAFSMSCGYFYQVRDGYITPDIFYKKRFVRIFPFYAVVVLLDVIIMIFTKTFTAKSFADAFSDLTLLFGFISNENRTVIGVGWTLGIIFGFYIIFPYFVFTIESKKRAWLAFAISVFLSLICQIFYPNTNGVIISLPYFYAGGLIYIYIDKIKKIFGKYKYFSLFICLGVTVIWNLSPDLRLSGGELFQGELDFNFLKNIFCFSLWICWCISKSNKVLSSKSIKFISNLTFEIYLCHMIIYRVLEKMHLLHIFDNEIFSSFLTTILTFFGAGIFALIIKHFIGKCVAVFNF